MPIRIEPKDRQEWLELKVSDVTSTEISCLFGYSPYSTPYELYHNKRNRQVVEIDDNERMKWGRRLQDAIAAGISEDRNWTAEPLNTYMRHDTVKGMGSSFDWKIISPEREGDGILEIKNVDYIQYKKEWLVDGDDVEAPVHIELQLQHQLEVANLDWGVIAAFIGGNKPIILERDRDRELGQIMCGRVKRFWKELEAGIEPPVDYLKDAEIIKRIYRSSQGEPLTTDDARISDLCARYKILGENKKLAEDDQKAVKSELLTRIGNAPKVFCGGFTISAGEINRKGYVVEPTIYRDFRINEKRS